MYPVISVIVLCLATFMSALIVLNLIITLMGDLYQGIKKQQDFVFQRNRASLVLEIESTMNRKAIDRHIDIPPYLHLLRPINLEYNHQDDQHESGSHDGGGGGRPSGIAHHDSRATPQAAIAAQAAAAKGRPPTAAPLQASAASQPPLHGDDVLFGDEDASNMMLLSPGQHSLLMSPEPWKASLERTHHRLASKVNGLAVDLTRRMDKLMSTIESLGSDRDRDGQMSLPRRPRSSAAHLHMQGEGAAAPLHRSKDISGGDVDTGSRMGHGPSGLSTILGKVEPQPMPTTWQASAGEPDQAETPRLPGTADFNTDAEKEE